MTAKLRRRLIEIRRPRFDVRPPPLILPDRFPRCRWKWDRELFPATAAVTFNAKTATWTNVNGVTTLTINNLTVAAGSNRALLVLLIFESNTGFPAGITLTRDTGETFAQVSGTSLSDNGPPDASVLYGLINPTTGLKNIVVSWTGNLAVHACAIAFNGVDQTSVAVAFPHGNTAHTSGASPASVTITSATGNMVVAEHCQNFSPWGAISGTTLATDDVTGPNLAVGANYDNGAATVAMTAAFTGTGPWSSIGCDVLAAGGGAAAVPYNPWPLWGPVLSQ